MRIDLGPTCGAPRRHYILARRSAVRMCRFFSRFLLEPPTPAWAAAPKRIRRSVGGAARTCRRQLSTVALTHTSRSNGSSRPRAAVGRRLAGGSFVPIAEVNLQPTERRQLVEPFIINI